jgi:hypothetical protein
MHETIQEQNHNIKISNLLSRCNKRYFIVCSLYLILIGTFNTQLQKEFKMIKIIGMFLIATGILNFAWFLLWALLAFSGSAGARLSKKVGTANSRTDKAIKIADSFGKEVLKKIATSAVLAGIGCTCYYLIG